MYHMARLRLNNIGVSQIYGGTRCTFSEEEQFFSYRRDGVTGRMASLIWIDK
jgi:copper oxidase (laccase) domain-containing protein